MSIGVYIEQHSGSVSLGWFSKVWLHAVTIDDDEWKKGAGTSTSLNPILSARVEESRGERVSIAVSAVGVASPGRKESRRVSGRVALASSDPEQQQFSVCLGAGKCVCVCVKEKRLKWVAEALPGLLHVEAIWCRLRGVASSGCSRVTCRRVGIARVARLGGHWSRRGRQHQLLTWNTCAQSQITLLAIETHFLYIAKDDQKRPLVVNLGHYGLRLSDGKIFKKVNKTTYWTTKALFKVSLDCFTVSFIVSTLQLNLPNTIGWGSVTSSSVFLWLSASSSLSTWGHHREAHRLDRLNR